MAWGGDIAAARLNNLKDFSHFDPHQVWCPLDQQVMSVDAAVENNTAAEGFFELGRLHVASVGLERLQGIDADLDHGRNGGAQKGQISSDRKKENSHQIPVTSKNIVAIPLLLAGRLIFVSAHIWL
jgi:hypothetical protein